MYISPSEDFLNKDLGSNMKPKDTANISMALDLADSHCHHLDMMLAEAHHNLALVYKKQTLFGKSFFCFSECLKIYERACGRKSVQYTNTLYQMAILAMI